MNIIIGRAYVTTLTSYNYWISSLVSKLEMTIFMVSELLLSATRMTIDQKFLVKLEVPTMLVPHTLCHEQLKFVSCTRLE